MRLSRIANITETSRCKALGSESSLMLHHYIGKDLTPTDMWEYVEEVKVSGELFKLFYSESKDLYMVFNKIVSYPDIIDVVHYKLLTRQSFVEYTRNSELTPVLKPIPMVVVKELEVIPIVSENEIRFTGGSNSTIVNMIKQSINGELSPSVILGKTNYYVTKPKEDYSNFIISDCVSVNKTRFFSNFNYKGKEVYIRNNYFNKFGSDFYDKKDMINLVCDYRDRVNIREIKDRIFINKTLKEAYVGISDVLMQRISGLYEFIKRGDYTSEYIFSMEKIEEIFSEDVVPISEKINIIDLIKSTYTIKTKENVITVYEFLKSLEEDDIYVLYKR